MTTVSQFNRTTVVSSTFKPKPNVSLPEINDVSATGVQDGFTIIYSSANNKYELKSPVNLEGIIPTTVTGGEF